MARAGTQLVLHNRQLLEPLVGHLIDCEVDGEPARARIIEVNDSTSLIKVVPKDTRE
jgi:hypothetical protein